MGKGTVSTLIFDVKADTSKLVSGMEKAEKGVNRAVGNMKKTMVGLAASYASIASATKVISSGFDYNKSIEQAVQGLTSLAVATSSNTTSSGELLTTQQKYVLATKEAVLVMAQLEQINAETPHTLDQTNQIYKAMYVSMKNVGASTEQMVDLTKKISIASGSAGIEFNSLLAGVDGLASGTVLANSDLGRFLNGLGLTNETLKKSSDVVGLLQDKFSEFSGADTMNVAVSNLSNSWSQLTGKMTESTFEDVKVAANQLSQVLQSLSDEDIKNLGKQINNMAVASVKAVGFVSKAFIGFQSTANVAGTSIADVYLRITESSESYAIKSELLWKQTDNELKANQALVDGINSLAESYKKAGKEKEKFLNGSSGKLVKKDQDKDSQSLKIKLTHLKNLEKIEKEKFQVSKDIYEFSLQANMEYKRLQQEIVETNESVYKTFVDITGSDYDKWVLKVSDTMQLLASSARFSNDDMQLAWDSLQNTNPETKKDQKGFYSGWTDVVSQTFVDGIQDALDHAFDLKKIISSLSSGLGQSLAQTATNNVSNTVSKNGISSLPGAISDNASTFGLGLGLMAVSSGLELVAESERTLEESIRELAQVNKELARASTGTGSYLYNDLSVTANGFYSAYQQTLKDIENYNNSIGKQAADAAGNAVDIQTIITTGGLSLFTDVFDDISDTVSSIFGGGSSKDNSLQEAVNRSITALKKQALVIIESAETIEGFGKSFRDLYDNLTGTSYFSDVRGKEALQNVESSFGLDLESLLLKLGDQYDIQDIVQFKKDLAADVSSQEFADALEKSTKILDDFGRSGIDAMEDIVLAAEYQTKLNDQISKTYDSITGLKTFANNLAYQGASDAYGYASANSLFNKSLVDFASKLANGDDISTEISNIQKYAQDSLKFAQGNSQSANDYAYEVASLANNINAIADVGQTATLDTVEERLNEMISVLKDIDSNTEGELVVSA